LRLSANPEEKQPVNDDLLSNDSANPHLEQLLGARAAGSATRRQILQAGLGSAALAFFGLPAQAAGGGRPAIGFRPIAAATDDAVRVPEGYTLQLL